MEVIDLEAALDAADAAELTDAMRELYALECAVRGAQLRFVERAFASEAWAHDGASSLEWWLVGALRISYGNAKTLVRVALAIAELPMISASFCEGLTSWDQLVLVTQLADASSDELWAQKVTGYTTTDLRRELRAKKLRNGCADEETPQAFFSLHRANESYFRLRGVLSIEDGETVAAVVHQLAERQCDDVQLADYLPAPQRSADALVELAAQCLSGEFSSVPALVSVDVELSEFGRADGIGEINGSLIGIDILDRLLCDAKIQVRATQEGIPLGVSRQSRTLPDALKRVVRKRDRWCRFPGCERTRWVHVHHVRHWAKGGPTDVENMVLLCHQHHRLLHDSNWHIEGALDGPVRFVTDDGRELLSPQRRLRPDTRGLFSGWLDAEPAREAT